MTSRSYRTGPPDARSAEAPRSDRGPNSHNPPPLREPGHTQQKLKSNGVQRESLLIADRIGGARLSKVDPVRYVETLADTFATTWVPDGARSVAQA